MKKLIKSLILLLLTLPILSMAQVATPVKWSSSATVNTDGTALLQFAAKIDKGWHLYSPDIPDGGPIPTSLHLLPSSRISTIGTLTSDKKAITAYDSLFGITIGYYADKVILTQKVKIAGNAPIKVTGYIEYMVCDDERCLPPESYEFSIDLKLPETVVATSTVQTPVLPPNTTKTDSALATNVTAASADIATDEGTDDAETIVAEPSGKNRFGSMTAGQSLLWIFIAGFLGGLVALLTPCVFPMIPMTVSVFMKMSGGGNGVRNALLYGVAIVLIYVSLGFAVTAIFGADALNALSTHPTFNVIFFVLLVVFAAAFLGAFELQLPTSWANFFDRKVDSSQGFISIIFMAFTLALVSFSCTGPIIGTLLVQAAVSGSALAPITGMLGFSIALALPFTMFAMFPSMLKSLPRSGGWLNSVKVVLGFIELALAFKFLSTADLAAHWGILPRELFLAIWIVIFTLLGFYLLGKIKLSHDSDIENISVTRLFFAMTSFIFALWMLPGMWGAPLKAISAFPPPLASQEWRSGADAVRTVSTTPKKYQELFHCPSGIDCYFDLDEALAAGKAKNKPVLIDFTGHGCVNCRRMEASVLSDPAVIRILNEDYIVVSLYVDDRTMLPESEQVEIVIGGSKKKIRTIGNKWSAHQTLEYESNSQPYYVVVGKDGSQLQPARAYGLEIDEYVKFLEDGKAAFRK